MSSESQRLWFPTNEPAGAEPFVSARVKQEYACDSALLSVRGAETRVASVSSLPLANSGPAAADMCSLTHLNEPALLHNTLERTRASKVYTWVGTSQLVSVNPCQPLPALFGEAYMEQFRGRGSRGTMRGGPHR